MIPISTTRSKNSINPDKDSLLDILSTLFSHTNFNKCWLASQITDWESVVIYTDADDQYFQQITFDLSVKSIFIALGYAKNSNISELAIMRGDAAFMEAVPNNQHERTVKYLKLLDNRNPCNNPAIVFGVDKSKEST